MTRRRATQEREGGKEQKVQEVDNLRIAGQDMEEMHTGSGGVTVMEVGDLIGEQDRVTAAIP